MKLRHIAPAFLSILCVLCTAVRLMAGPEAAKQFDPKLFQELRWRMIGPFRGGRVLAVTAHMLGADAVRVLDPQREEICGVVSSGGTE